MRFYRDSWTTSWINWRKDSWAQRMVMEQTRTIKEMRIKARGGNYSDKRGWEERVTAEPCSIIPLGLRKQPLCQHAHSNWTHPALTLWCIARNFGRRLPHVSRTYVREQIRRPRGALPNLRSCNFTYANVYRFVTWNLPGFRYTLIPGTNVIRLPFAKELINF